jgi:hypothetical protein
MRNIALRLVVIAGSILAFLLLSVYVFAFPIGAADMIFERRILEPSEVETFRKSIPQKQLGIAVKSSPWMPDASGNEIARHCTLPLPLHVLYYRERFVLVSDKEADFERLQFRSDLRVVRVVCTYAILAFLCFACWVWSNKTPRNKKT